MSPHAHDEDAYDAHAHDAHDDIDACIEACLQCHVVCTMTAQYALTQGGTHADVAQVGLMLDCAQICQTSADFMMRGSPYHERTCGVCAEVCRACASTCRAFEDDENMVHCAEVCEECAEACEQMVGGGTRG